MICVRKKVRRSTVNLHTGVSNYGICLKHVWPVFVGLCTFNGFNNFKSYKKMEKKKKQKREEEEGKQENL
jgi:hypothetical protein